MKSTNKRIERVNKAVVDFGGLLHDYRLSHNLSLQDMSQIMGYSASYIWRIENYKRYPEMSTKLKILIQIWSLEDVYDYLDVIVKGQKEMY